jgi:hypothetical protein
MAAAAIITAARVHGTKLPVGRCTPCSSDGWASLSAVWSGVALVVTDGGESEALWAGPVGVASGVTAMPGPTGVAAADGAVEGGCVQAAPSSGSVGAGVQVDGVTAGCSVLVVSGCRPVAGGPAGGVAGVAVVGGCVSVGRRRSQPG